MTTDTWVGVARTAGVHLTWRRGLSRWRFEHWRIVLLTPGILLLGLFFVVLSAQPVFASAESDDLLSLLTRMDASYAEVKDYTAVFHKQERIDRKFLPEETIFLKFQKPLKVYMKWIEEPLKDTEALYVQGQYDNKLVVHRGGVLGFLTLSLDPGGATALKENRHPITETGFGFLIEGIRNNLRTALKYGELKIIRMGDEVFKGRPVTVLEVKSTPREGRKYYASRMVCHVDKEMLLPIAVDFYDEKDVLFEKYYFTDVKLNVGLSAMDFSRDNHAYHF